MISSLLTLSLLLSPHGTPDKFWLTQGDANAEGSRPAVVEGVLLGEDATSYHVRVKGGEVWLPRAQVAKVEKDALTVEAIERLETEEKEKRQEAAKAAEAEAKPAPEGEKAASEAPAAKSDAAKPVEQAQEEQPARFDPVRGRFQPGTAPARQSPLRALEASYEASGDRAVLKELRRARRAK